MLRRPGLEKVNSVQKKSAFDAPFFMSGKLANDAGRGFKPVTHVLYS